MSTKFQDKHVLMFSGGLDSYLAYLVLRDNDIDPQLVYANLGHRYMETEWAAAQALAISHGKDLFTDNALRLGGREEENAFIPNRNGFLAMIGAFYGNHIWMAIMDGEQSYHDCKEGTFVAMSMALTALSGKSTLVDSPFWDKTKTEVIRALDPKYYGLLTKTRSCHHQHLFQGEHCGECPACFRRWVAFSLNGIKDKYVHLPWSSAVAAAYYRKASKGEYGPKRSQEILDALAREGIF
jgi:7-cyano-7-deazaguanine synthase in queuosine biosynthesis